MSELRFEEILETSKRLCQSNQISALCLYGSRQCGYSREDSDYDVLAILENYDNGVRYQYEPFRNVYLALLKVDRELFELDVSKSVLGEFVAGRLLSPYLPLIEGEYLSNMEVLLKQKIVEEELVELILGYGELARGLVISPEYIVLSRMRRRFKVYPPLKYSYLCLLRPDLVEINMPRILEGYSKAFIQVSKKGMVRIEDGKITISHDYVDQILSRKTSERVVNIARASRRALYSYLAHGRAGRTGLDMIAKELASKIKREISVTLSRTDFEDPNRHLFLKTSAGLVSLNEAASIIEAVKKLRPSADITVSSLGGALNEVYLVRANDEKMVAKRFSDWYGFKWFTLNLVALGTKIFSVSGRARLSNEYGMSTLLTDNKILVPSVVYVSIQERLLIKQYVEGQDTLKAFESYLRGDHLDSKQVKIASSIGNMLARIHALDVTLGDSKPENLIWSSNERLYVLDLEQAKKKGDKAWDIAEFVYFTGHYSSVMTGALRELTQAFIQGYKELGDPNLLKRAAGINYAKVFSFWTPPQITREMSIMLKEA